MSEGNKKEWNALEYERSLQQKVIAAREDIAQGRVIAAEEVENEALEWRKNLLNKG